MTVAILAPLSAPAFTQQLPVYPGASVRLAQREGAPWLSGEVVSATRDSFELQATGLAASRWVEFNRAMRLEVRQDSCTGAAIGGSIGLVIGTVVGAALVSPALPDRAPDGLVTVTTGGLSAIIGALIGRGVGPARWVEVPLTRGRIAPAPLTVHPYPAGSWSTTQRWERFAASEADFAAFLTAHRDSLHPVEGLWTPLGSALAQRIEGRPVRRMVVVRDARFHGFSYVGVYVSRRAPTRDDGIILLALTAPDEHGVMELRHVGPSLRRERRILVELTGDILTLVEPNGRVALWQKSTLVP